MASALRDGLRISAMHEEEQYTGLPLHYLFGAIPVGGNN
jgi:hypothetical protein